MEFPCKMTDDRFYDEIKFKIIPRHKESFASGDEWRTSCQIQLFSKGTCVYENCFGTIKDALISTLSVLDTLLISNTDHENKCFQYGCSNDATVKYEINERFSIVGEKLDKEEYSQFRYYRKFCDEHSIRGDCSREDSDGNYQVQHKS